MKKVYSLLISILFIGVIQTRAQCSANFQYALGSNPLSIQFFDSSLVPTGATINYTWNFGDGSFSGFQNPSHTYAQTGTYNVCLNIMDSLGNCFDSLCQNIMVVNNQPPCMANFTYNINPNNNVDFFSSVTGGTAPYLYNWDFSTGTVSTLASPTYSFGVPGSYLVTLTVTDANGITCTYSDSVNIGSCSALFSHSSYNSGIVNFTNLSIPLNAANTNINWNFGDGNFSNSIHPTHQYASSGTYTVTLNYFDSLSNCSATYSDSIFVAIFTTNNCSAGYSYSTSGDTLRVINSSSNYNSISYDFGDGTNPVSGVDNPTHIYNTSGTFTVCQTITDTLNNCTDSICQTITISLIIPNSGCCAQTFDSLMVNPCRSDFNYTKNIDTLFIENRSAFNTVSYDFGDGTTSTEENPFHVYQQSGTYNVCQFINADGCSASYCDSISIVIPPQCSAGFNYSFSSDTTYFTNTSVSGNRYIYRFGDGSTSNVKDPFHLYPYSGTYVVELEIFNDTTFCSDLFIDTIQVTVSFSCKAEFIPALDTTQVGVLFLINNSSNDNTHSYLWDFGDGNTSTSRIPSHEFTENRAYRICLTVSDSVQNCSSTFCDSIGLDSSGNIVESNGFRLKVIEGAALSVSESKKQQSLVKVFPNPFQSTFTLEKIFTEEGITYELYSSRGQLITEGRVQGTKEHLAFDYLESGLYILRIQKGEQSSSIKLIKQ